MTGGAEATRSIRVGYLTIIVQTAPGLAMLRLDGELDIATARQAEAELRALEAGDAARIVIDLERLEFLDSTGMGFLVAAAKRAGGEPGRIRFTRPGTAAVADVLEMTGLDDVLYTAAA